MEIEKTIFNKNGSFLSLDQLEISSLISLKKRDGQKEFFSAAKMYKTIDRVCFGLEEIDKDLLYQYVLASLYDGISSQEFEMVLILNSTSFIERDPAYSILAQRLLLDKLYKEVFKISITENTFQAAYKEAFIRNIQLGIQNKLLHEGMAGYNLELLAEKLVPERDQLFEYMGISTLYERYLLKVDGKRVEMPQTFFMRIAMGLALEESNKTERAIEFYTTLSQLYYMPSTPTLFHAGFPVAQLSSCYLNTVNDDLSHIFKVISDNAQLSKWAGGIGSDWTSIRGTGSYIKSIKATTQGVVPFLKVANDVVNAITRTGIRRGGTCIYLETWHFDIEDFLDLRKNTGDERRRTHDINTANWIPDLFMKRVLADGIWTLFSPDETPDIHKLYGKEFEARYVAYELKAREGKMNQFKEISAKQLWRKMLTRIFETGHPWLTWKDPINIRSPQDHAGVVLSSNLCTEITLNTSETETAVCNLGSLNLEKHIIDGVVAWEKIQETIKTAIRMLDNIIDINFYPTIEAKNSNMLHRPIGFGLMGFQDALFLLRIPFESQKALTFADELSEYISYYALLESSKLAKERGAYTSYNGSKWSRGIFPYDTLELVEKEREILLDTDKNSKLDWSPVREHVARYGMRNSNVLSIAPTATISTIVGCYPSIEPIYKNIYTKANTSGEFTIINRYLVKDLKERSLWSKDLVDQLKFHDGDLAAIESIPEDLKLLYKTAFELDPVWLLRITAARGKWIDQSQSHNIFLRNASGSKLNEVYMAAWKLGMKTTYYLRTLGATQIEKSTLDAKQFGYTQKREYIPVKKACSIETQDCDSCQ